MIIKITLLTWLLVTLSSGFNMELPLYGHLPVDFHPQWALLTILPVMGLYYSGLRRNALRGGVFIMIGLALATFIGLGVHMGFLPILFHQVIVWALIPLLIWSMIKL